ncbi:hypothetical protein [Nonomuraea sp. JJY05]|uniref:hypothetical protein n=1 Tax=Nonomuraea sp. JJY05 TaxID=3350255 RepID=UPI00373F6065
MAEGAGVEFEQADRAQQARPVIGRLIGPMIGPVIGPVIGPLVGVKPPAWCSGRSSWPR